MGTKLTNAPVYYTVAQIQFNPILDLDGYIPAIQSKMREAHLPDFKKEVFQRILLPYGGVEQGQMAAPTVMPQSRYLFGDVAGRTLFLLMVTSPCIVILSMKVRLWDREHLSS